MWAGGAYHDRAGEVGRREVGSSDNVAFKDGAGLLVFFNPVDNFRVVGRGFEETSTVNQSAREKQHLAGGAAKLKALRFDARVFISPNSPSAVHFAPFLGSLQTGQSGRRPQVERTSITRIRGSRENRRIDQFRVGVENQV